MIKMIIAISPLLTFHTLKITRETIVFNKDLRKYCVTCINFKKPLCPPKVPYWEPLIDRFFQFRLVYVKFDFAKYKESWRKIRPLWSEGQLGNSRHWQKTVKGYLGRYISNFHYEYMLGCGAGLRGFPSMEAVGINVFDTCEKNDIVLEGKYLKPITHYLHFVSLLLR